ncbi:MAG: AAA family ATPase, partial [Myxococcota bacterium]|nr:AAA family ATPase [Myxococcota bacterium]
MSPHDLLERFRALGVLRPLDLHLARAVGRMAGESDPLVLLGVAAASRVHGAGHICLELGAFRDQVRVEALEGQEIPWPEAAAWEAALNQSPLVRGSGSDARTPIVLEGHRLYLDRYWGYQRRLVAQVEARVGRATTEIGPEALEAALTRLFPPNPAIADEDLQRTSARTAAQRGFTIITGGPGTGKTTTIKRLMALLIGAAWDRGAPTPRFALMAPTGKAAARMKESIRAVETRVPLHATDEVKAALPDEASTIHRALGFNPRHRTQFKRNADNPLDADVIIVDEASMIDLALMVKLFEAVRPEARLVLLGDADQLKSVEAGAVLGDLCRGLREGVVELTYTHRFGADSGVGA